MLDDKNYTGKGLHINFLHIILGAQTGTLMRQYFIYDGFLELGPFDLEEIREQKLTKTTRIRYEDDDDWTTVEHMEELSEFVIGQAEPEQIILMPTSITQKVEPVAEPIKENKKSLKDKLPLKPLLLGIGLFLGIAIGSVGVFSYKPTPSVIVPAYHKPVKKVVAVAPPPVIPAEPQHETEPVAKPEEKPSTQHHAVVNDKAKEIRKNWTKYITAINTSYAYGVLGGIDNLSVKFSNNTDYPLDVVTAKVTYIKANGKPWKSKLVSIYNIPPHSDKEEPLPKVIRGKSVQVSIQKVTSRKMHFNYDPSRLTSDPSDPYYSK